MEVFSSADAVEEYMGCNCVKWPTSDEMEYSVCISSTEIVWLKFETGMRLMVCYVDHISFKIQICCAILRLWNVIATGSVQWDVDLS